MKPRIVPECNPMRPWKLCCYTDEVSTWGNRFRREGKGYTPRDAYAKWLRNGR